MKVKADRDESLPYPAILAAHAQDVSQRCKEQGINDLHINLWATGGNKTKTPGLGAQPALRRRALARSSIRIGRMGCNSDSHEQYSKKGWQERKKVVIPSLLQNRRAITLAVVAVECHSFGGKVESGFTIDNVEEKIQSTTRKVSFNFSFWGSETGTEMAAINKNFICLEAFDFRWKST